MKKTNMILSAAVAGLFAVSAHAGKDAKKAEVKEVAGATEESCKTAGDSWKDGKCWHAGCASEGKAGCGGTKDAKAATTAPATTTPAAAPAKK